MKLVRKVLPILMVSAILTACGANESQVTKESKITIKKLAAANSYGARLKRHNTIACNTVYYNEEGDADYSTYNGVNVSGNDYVTTYEDSMGYTEFFKGDCTYSFCPEDNSFGMWYLIEDQLGDYEEQIKNTNTWVDEDEAMLSNVVGSGIGTMMTEVPIDEVKTFFNSYFDLTDYESIHYIYNYDEDTLELQSCQEIAYAKDHYQIMSETQFSYSDEGIEAPDFVTDLENSKDTRKVTLHMQNGETKEYIVPKQVKFYMNASAGYELYVDQNGKVTWEESNDGGETDMDLYMLKVK